jgi:SWIM zinc finger
VVDFEARECTCDMWQEYLSPCAHAIVGSRHLGRDPYLLFDRAYTILNYRLTYQQGLPPISAQDIPCFPDLLPPLVVRKRGRPRVRRMRKRERYQDGQRKCGNSWCRQLGHNTRTCDTAQDQESSGESESETESEEEFPELVKDAREAALAGRPSRAAIAAAEIRERRAQIQREAEQARQAEIDYEAEFAAVFGVDLDPPIPVIEARRSTRVKRAPKSRD